jgi:hypothetical protein
VLAPAVGLAERAAPQSANEGIAVKGTDSILTGQNAPFVGRNPRNVDAKALVKGNGGIAKSDCADRLLFEHDPCVDEARGVGDTDMDELLAARLCRDGTNLAFMR